MRSWVASTGAAGPPAALALAALLAPALGQAQTCTWGGTPSLPMPAVTALRSDARLLGAPLGLLLPGCCNTAAALRSCSINNTARVGGCCIDDPPGYEGNYSATFNHVPAGTWYYPVRSGAGASAHLAARTGRSRGRIREGENSQSERRQDGACFV